MASQVLTQTDAAIQSNIVVQSPGSNENFDAKHTTLPSKCTWVGCLEKKTFIRKSDFKKHMDKHTKPYICTETSCNGPNFGDKAGLRRHESEKHGKHGAVRYFCQLSSCPRNRQGFARQKNRDLHVKTCHKTSSRQGANDYFLVGDAEDFSKYPEPSVGEVEMNDNQVENGRSGGTGEMDGLRVKLRELEMRKRELAVSQARVDEDIQALKRTMQLVSA